MMATAKTALCMISGGVLGTVVAYVITSGVWSIFSQKLLVQNLFREIPIMDSLIIIFLLLCGCLGGTIVAYKILRDRPVS